MRKTFPAALGVAASAVLVLAGCAAGSVPPARLAALTSHVVSDTIVPVTEGRGDRRLAAVEIEAGRPVGIEASCVGVGTVTVTIPSGVALTAACSPSGGSQTATSDYPGVPGVTGPVTVTVSAPGLEWNATVYYGG